MGSAAGRARPIARLSDGYNGDEATILAERDKQYVIIGNGVAGTTAAETIRKNDPNCRVILIGDEPYPLYNRVALPPFIKRRVDRRKVTLRTVEAHAELGIDLRLCTRVISVDAADRTVVTSEGDELRYDALLVATGGRPNGLDVPGAELKGIYNFQYLDDALGILERVETAKVAVAVGGSYIAYELAEAFRHDGLETFWLIRGNRFLRRVLDEDGGAFVDDIATQAGVQTIYNDAVAEVKSDNGQVRTVVTQQGLHLKTDMLGIGVGLTMNMEFLSGTGVETRYGVLTNEYLETKYSSTLFDSFIRVIGLTPENYPDLESYERLDVRNRSYQRLFFLGNRLVGACLIGNSRFRTRIFTLIKSQEEIPVEDRARLLEE